MSARAENILWLMVIAAVLLLNCLPAHSESKPMTNRAHGSFEVKLTPALVKEEQGDGWPLGRMIIDKTFSGDLQGKSKGEMLTAMSGVKGSAGYVALEAVSGTLQGRTGSFVLQHTGTMTRGAPSLSVTVVPDSGRGQLVGLEGRMTIVIEGGKHSYEFEYALVAAK